MALKLLHKQKMESGTEYGTSPCSKPITTTRVKKKNVDLNVNPDAYVASECSTEREDLSPICMSNFSLTRKNSLFRWGIVGKFSLSRKIWRAHFSLTRKNSQKFSNLLV